jgi:hypothetical protein
MEGDAAATQELLVLRQIPLPCSPKLTSIPRSIAIAGLRGLDVEISSGSSRSTTGRRLSD